MATLALMVPCYNAAPYLDTLLASIAAQTEPFDEVLFYNDASTDNTVQKLQQAGVKYYSGASNYGPSYARNHLIEQTTCTWVHFHDADDLLHPHFVYKAKQFIDQEPDTQWLCGAEVRELLHPDVHLGTISFTDLNSHPDAVAYFLNKVAYASMGVYQVTALKTINGFRVDLKTNEDPDLHVRLAAAGFMIKAIPDKLVTKLEHANSYSHTNWMQCMLDKYTCFEGYYNVLGPQYWSLIGAQAAILACYFYTHKQTEFGQRAYHLAKRCKVKAPPNGSFFAHTFCALFGFKAYLKLLQVRHT